MNITYGQGFRPTSSSRQAVARVRRELSTLAPYEPQTTHYFHAGMYCREVWRDAGACVIGAVHKKEHFYLIVSGTVVVTTDDGREVITGPRLLRCKPGTQRAVLSLTPARCMTFHVTQATTVEAAERELVQDDADSMYGPGNLLKHQPREVLA